MSYLLMIRKQQNIFQTMSVVSVERPGTTWLLPVATKNFPPAAVLASIPCFPCSEVWPGSFNDSTTGSVQKRQVQRLTDSVPWATIYTELELLEKEGEKVVVIKSKMRENILDKIFVTLLNAGFRSSDPEGEFICCLFLGSYDKNCVIYTWRKIHMTTDKLQFFFTKKMPPMLLSSSVQWSVVQFQWWSVTWYHTYNTVHKKRNNLRVIYRRGGWFTCSCVAP